MGDYDRHDYHEKKASGVAVGGLVTGITALGLGALGAFSGNNGCGNNGGLLGGLFNRNNGCNGYECSPMAVYNEQQKAAGQMAITELDLINKWIRPIQYEIDCIKTREAVTEAVTPLMIENQGLRFQDALDKGLCNVMRGVPMLRPEQMGEPYHGGYNVIDSHHVPAPRPRMPFEPCGCGGEFGPR